MGTGAAGPAAQAEAWFIRGYLATVKGNSAAAKPALGMAVAFAREAGGATLLCQALAVASVVARMQGDGTFAARLLDEVSTLAAGADDPDATLAFLQARSLNALLDGKLDEVRLAAMEGVRVSREADETHTLMNWLISLGTAQLMAGDVKEAKQVILEGLQAAQRIDDRTAVATFIEALACHAVATGQDRLGMQLLGAARAMQGETGGRTPFLAPVVARAEHAASDSLGPSKLEAELNAGRQMDADAAIRLALGQPSQVAVKGVNASAAGLLGKRESEVAELVAAGLSNKQIGARLFISGHTVDSHIRSIMNKLGFNSGAQIAAWIASNR
jgi:ATP/maltotriose-dependent transcriptional regulator MalT